MQEKNIMIEKIEDFEKKSREENEKLSNFSKNVKYFLKNFILENLRDFLSEGSQRFA